MTDSAVPSGGDSRTSTTLLRLAQGNDPAAWHRLVNLYSPLVYRWCRQAGLQDADCVDLGQEVFRAVARKLGDFRRDRAGDSFRGWVRAITRNKLRDHFRAQAAAAEPVGGSTARDVLGQIPDTADDSAAEPLREETALLYRRALDLIAAEFEPQTWQAFWRVAVEDQKPADVAQALGVTPNAVYLATSRIRRRLREEFADLLEP